MATKRAIDVALGGLIYRAGMKVALWASGKLAGCARDDTNLFCRD